MSCQFSVVSVRIVTENGRVRTGNLLVSVVAAEAVDEAAIALVGAPGGGGCGPGEGAEEFAFFSGFAAGFFAVFGFMVEGLGDGGGAALLAEGEDFDGVFAGFIFDVETGLLKEVQPVAPHTAAQVPELASPV